MNTFLVILTVVAVIIGISFILGLVFQLGWGAFMVPVLGLPTIGWNETAGIFVLLAISGLFFGGSGARKQ